MKPQPERLRRLEVPSTIASRGQVAPSAVLHLILLSVIIFGLTLLPQMVLAAQSKKRTSLSQQIGTLGGNEALLEKAQALEGKNAVRIVQKRAVDREQRFEFDLLMGQGSLGNSYLTSSHLGAAVEFHFNYRWSLGLRGQQVYSALTPEGEYLFEQAQSNGVNYSIPDIDYPLQASQLTLTFYPLYGKFNLLDWTVVHFDIYTMLGGGQMELKSGSTPLATLTLGMGLWLSQHLSSRIEFTYENYEEKPYTGPRRRENFAATLGVGFLL